MGDLHFFQILWTGKKLGTDETINQMIKQLKQQRSGSLPNILKSTMSSLELHQQIHQKLESILFYYVIIPKRHLVCMTLNLFLLIQTING
jgi:hypothetical protein